MDSEDRHNLTELQRGSDLVVWVTWESGFSSQHPKLEGKVGQESAILAAPMAEPKSPDQGEMLILLDRHTVVVMQRSDTATLTRHIVSFLRSKESYRPRKLVGWAGRSLAAALSDQTDSKSYGHQGFSE